MKARLHSPMPTKSSAAVGSLNIPEHAEAATTFALVSRNTTTDTNTYRR